MCPDGSTSRHVSLIVMVRGISASLEMKVKRSSSVACCMPSGKGACFFARYSLVLGFVFLRTGGAGRYTSPLRAVATSDAAVAIPFCFPGGIVLLSLAGNVV